MVAVKLHIVRSHETKLKSEQCRRILVALESGPKNIEDLAKSTKLTVGSVTKHAEVLIVAALVERKKDGTLFLRR